MKTLILALALTWWVDWPHCDEMMTLQEEIKQDILMMLDFDDDPEEIYDYIEEKYIDFKQWILDCKGEFTI